MATQKITLKRVINSSGGTDVLYPTTTLDQIFTVDGNGDITETSLSSYLGSTYVAQSTLGQNNGVATLDGSGTLTPSQLPSSVVGGMKFANTVDLSTTRTGDYLAGRGMTEVGDYLIVTNTGSLTNTGSTIQLSVRAPGDEGDNNIGTLELEAGDWIILSATGTNAYTLAIINNTYRDAGTATKGIVQLSAASDTTGTTDEVITESILGGLVVADDTDLSSGTPTANKIAPAHHDHDTAYEPKRSTSGTAYNKDFGTGLNDVARGNHTHGEYVETTGDTMTGDLTMRHIGESSNTGSRAINFRGYAGFGTGSAGTFDRYLSMDSDGNLQFGTSSSRQNIYVIESTSFGRTLYNTTSGAVEGDFIIDVD